MEAAEENRDLACEANCAAQIVVGQEPDQTGEQDFAHGIAARSPHGRLDDDGPGPFRPAPGLREAA